MRTHGRRPRKRRGSGRPWPKGVSGNPGGRPKVLAEIRSLAQEHTTEAVKALVLALKSPGERVAAAKVLLSYGYGPPVQAVEIGGVPRDQAPRPIDAETVRDFLAARDSVRGGNGTVHP